MTDEQKAELRSYLEQAREYTHSYCTFKDDRAVISDFMERFGDDLTWENIEEAFSKRIMTQSYKDMCRRALYRWKAFKEGEAISAIIDNYTGQKVRACEMQSCLDRDYNGFCTIGFRYRGNCPTLKAHDAAEDAKILLRQPEKKEAEKADWIFGMRCSYKGSASAVFNGRI